MPADQPQLIADKDNGLLYCLWHGNDDTTDVSSAGFCNGEIYGAYSLDGGITWSEYVNLTNTRSPGAGPGACFDEDYMTANPYIVRDSIWTTYIEDKDAGAFPMSEGTLTENPVRCWVFPTTMITGIEEYDSNQPAVLSLQVTPNPFLQMTDIRWQMTGTTGNDIDLKIYDASGRLVKSFPLLAPDALRATLCWDGTDQHNHPVPAGIYFITLTAGDQKATIKTVKLE